MHRAKRDAPADAGLRALAPNAPARAECMRIARRLRAARNKVIGFIPARDDVAVPPIAVQLGLALIELTGTTVAFVDANVRHPALSELAASEAETSSVYSTRWLDEHLAVLTPRHAEEPGRAVPALARLLIDGADLFEYVLVDLTGLELFGEHASAAACCDGVILVGRARSTREGDVLRLMGEMPVSRFSGVLLVG